MKMGNENDLIPGMLLSANHVIRPITVQSSTSSLMLNTCIAELLSIFHWFEARIADAISSFKWMKNKIIYEKQTSPIL